MKKVLYILIILLPALSGMADQLAYIDESQAKKAVEFLKGKKQLILWCACCNGDAQRLIPVSKVGYKYTGYNEYYEVYIEGTDNKGAQGTYDLDLAYTHYMQLGGKAYNVGKALGFECDPCTEPFAVNIKEEPKPEDIDLAKLFGKETEFLGMIGGDVQRMGVVFLSTKKVGKNRYEVTGKTKVKKNVCDFTGVIEAERVTKSGLEEDYYDRYNADGKIMGKYLFNEDKKQSGTGVFEGTFEIYYAGADGKFNIGYAPFYSVIFNGTWKGYVTGASKKACWNDKDGTGCFPADFNVSDIDDLIPDEKYRSAGWGYLIDQWSFDAETRAKGKKEYNDNWLNWWR